MGSLIKEEENFETLENWKHSQVLVLFKKRPLLSLIITSINSCGAPEARDDPEDPITALLNVTEDCSFWDPKALQFLGEDSKELLDQSQQCGI